MTEHVTSIQINALFDKAEDINKQLISAKSNAKIREQQYNSVARRISEIVKPDKIQIALEMWASNEKAELEKVNEEVERLANEWRSISLLIDRYSMLQKEEQLSKHVIET